MLLWLYCRVVICNIVRVKRRGVICQVCSFISHWVIVLIFRWSLQVIKTIISNCNTTATTTVLIMVRRVQPDILLFPSTNANIFNLCNICTNTAEWQMFLLVVFIVLLLNISHLLHHQTSHKICLQPKYFIFPFRIFFEAPLQ